MTISGLTNSGAQSAQTNMQRFQAQASDAVEKMSSGTKINRASVDASGLSIARKLESDIRVLDQAKVNANQGASLLQTVTDNLGNTMNILTEMKALSAKANTDSIDDNIRNQLQADYVQLLDQVDKIGEQTRWNGVSLLTGSPGDIGEAGAEALAVDNTQTAPADTFDSVDTDASQGLISGTVSSISVEQDGSEYTVTLTLEDDVTSDTTVTRSFVGTSTPESGETLTLSDGNGNEIAIDYDDTTVDFADADAVKTALDTLFDVEGTPASFTSLSTDASGTGFVADSVTATSVTDTGRYAFSSEANSGTISLTDGTNTWEATLEESSGIESVTFDNGVSLNIDHGDFDATTGFDQMTFTVGESSDVQMSFQVAELATDTLDVSIGGATSASLRIDSTDLTSTANAVIASDRLDAAIQSVNENVSTLGAQQRQLESSQEVLQTRIQNTEAAKSSFFDADVAEEMQNLTQSTVMSQVGQAAFGKMLEIQQSLSQLVR